MCGIFMLFGQRQYEDDLIKTAFTQSKHRGPEFSTINRIKNIDNVIIGFHRLAINGLNTSSHQPLEHNGIYLICNGEIYNYKQLYEEQAIIPKTESDCEVILHLYERFGLESTLNMIDGVFAFILVDTNKGLVLNARDVYGVRPMFHLKNTGMSIGFASEMKQLIPLHRESDIIEQVTPGTFSVYKVGTTIEHITTSAFSCFPYIRQIESPYPSEYTIHKYFTQICMRLTAAVNKRVTTTDRPIACLLSGGLDSSLVTALVAKHFKDPSKLETYSIGLEGSEDLKYAELVAKHLGTTHTSIVVSDHEFLDAIPEVIYAIESYDTTTIRASVGNFLIAKYIKEHSEAKVIFNGDGSDEMTGGYLYLHECPSSREFDIECKRLLKNIHYFDVLRSDRCIAYHGLEARTPFLDRSLVEEYLTIPCEIRNHTISKQCEKFLLRQAFSCMNLLPKEVLWRTKEAFSDGVSSHKKSWYLTIQENIPKEFQTLAQTPIDNESVLFNPPQTVEQQYYRTIFEKHYKGMGSIIPYFWMPKYTDSLDCSARSLNIYESLVQI
jgi:asparagine synthase (glutamine-hydrolysing)